MTPPPDRPAADAANTDRELNIVHAHLDGISSLAGGLPAGSYAAGRTRDDIQEHVSKIRSSLERLADCLPPVEISIPCDECDWQTDADGNTYCAACGSVCKHGGSCHCREGTVGAGVGGEGEAG